MKDLKKILRKYRIEMYLLKRKMKRQLNKRSKLDKAIDKKALPSQIILLIILIFSL